ncbi:hypothetical protein DESC_880070 [Desulfosarcina cetonica]|nr:hypothetical protein DESC_880070 [Desulfosarcina cetonica]
MQSMGKRFPVNPVALRLDRGRRTETVHPWRHSLAALSGACCQKATSRSDLSVFGSGCEEETMQPGRRKNDPREGHRMDYNCNLRTITQNPG